jgi:hypothetical protein
VTSAGGEPLYATLKEIQEVQYAQNYNVMILAHQNHAPIIVSVSSNGSGVSAERFAPNIGVEVVADDTLDAGMYYEQDKTYIDNGYLFEAGKYPACVTFFQGRLVFANCANARQRLFFSKVNDMRRFATYKLFLKENKEYIVANGTINDKSRVVELSDIAEVAKFNRKLLDYYIESSFFDPATKIESLSGKTLRLTRDANVPAQLTSAEKTGLEEWKNRADNREDNPIVMVLGKPNFKKNGTSYWVETTITATLKTTSITMREDLGGHQKVVSFNENNSNFTTDAAREFLLELYDDVAKLCFPDDGTILRNLNNANFADMMYELAALYYFFRFALRGKIFKGTPDSIYVEITSYYYFEGAAVTIPFYTKALVEDRYPAPDDGFTFEIASDMNDAIRWAAQNKSLLVGTETSEWVIPAGITATNIQAIINSRYGSDAIQATAVGDALCFFQSGKKGLVEYYIPQQDNNFRANNMAMLSPNMLRESPATDFDFVSAPHTKIFVCREDGVVVSLLYERGTGTFAWSRVVTNGRIVSVATLPGESGFDDVCLVVERNGACFLERLDERDRVYLDSHKEWKGDAPKYLTAQNGDYLVAQDGKNLIVGGYDFDAVVYDETDNRIWPVESAPQPNPAHKMWIGYPYASRLRSMPILANDQMKVNIIKALSIRFNGSYMPRVKSRPDGPEEHIPKDEPYTGIVQIPFPGSYERDAFFELTHDGPTPCRVLAINAEAQ